MSNNNSLNDAVQLAIAAAKAYYGDFRALTVQAIKYAPQIITIVCAIFLFIVIIPVAVIQSVFTGGTESETFAEPAAQAFAYGQDWVKVLAAMQVKNMQSSSEGVNIADAAQAVESGRLQEFIGGEESMKLYDDTFELLNNSIGSYAGEVNYYDEIPFSGSGGSVKKVYDSFSGKTILASKSGTLYDSNNVVDFKIDIGRIKIKYSKFGLKAYFPVPGEYASNFSDDFGNDRINDGELTGHQGNDIFASRNTPEIAVEDCKIKKIGWNGLGGWRILMESRDGLRTYYYAHMEKYAEGLEGYMDGTVHDDPGVEFKAGEVVGYVGSSGGFDSNCPPGTDTGTPTHIHFQIWVKAKGFFSDQETLINPYFSLKLLETNKDRTIIDNKLREEGFSID